MGSTWPISLGNLKYLLSAKTFHFNSTGQDNQQFHTYFRSIIKKVAKKSTHPGTRDTAAPLEGPAKELNTSQVQAIKCYKKNNNLI